MNPNVSIEAIYPAGYLNLISETMKRLEIPQTVNQWVPYDAQCRVSPGDVVQMIVMDMLTGRQAMMHLSKWAARLDLDKLLLTPGVAASAFNDDAIARHLDRISEAGVHELFSEITLRAWRQNPGSVLAFHSDTTSKSVYGAYKSQDDEDLYITEGYSRDRPGDKQFQYGLVVDSKGRPIYGDVHDGNESDKSWNPEVLTKLQAQLKKLDLRGFIYVADSAAMSKDTLERARQAGAYLITRGGQNLKIVKHALDEADMNEQGWSQPIAFATSGNRATYRLQEFRATYEDHAVRLIVVESSALDKKKAHSLEKAVEAERTRLETAMKEGTRLVFHCEADAIQAMEQWQHEHAASYHTFTMSCEAFQDMQRTRGRPKKEAVPEFVTRYRFVFRLLSRAEEAIQTARRRASRFVLVTTVPEVLKETIMDAEQVLSTYKGQIQVECNFSFLKDPFFVDEIYLKKPHRVEVLGYLFLIALLVFHTIQGKVREQTSERKPLIATTNRKLAQPTAREIFRLLEYIQVVVFRMTDGSRWRQLGQPLEREQKRLLAMFGLDESIYV